MEKKIINEITRIQELMSKKILVEGGTPTLFTKLIKFFEKNAGDDGLPFLSPSSSELKLLKAEKSLLKKFDIILNLAKTNKNIRNQLIKFVNAGIPPAELQKLNDLKTFLIKYSNKDKTILKNTVNKKLDLMMTDSKVREIIKLDFDDYVDNLKPTPKPKIPKKIPKVKKVKPEPTVVKNNKMLGYEINKAIEDAFVNKEIPKKHIQKFKDEFEKAVIKQVDKIPKETIDKLDFCIKELDKMEGLDRQDLVEKIIRNYEALTKKNMPLRDKQRLKNFLLGKNFSKGEDWEEKGVLFLKHWFSKCLTSTGIYGASYAADAFAEAHGNEKAKELMYDKGDTAWGAFLFRILGGPFGLLSTIIMDFIPSMWNSLVAFLNQNKDDRKLLRKAIDAFQLFTFKGRLRYDGVLDKYVNLITINSDGFPVYTYKGTQYDIYNISTLAPNKACIIIKGETPEEDKTFYLTGPQFKK
jgi:hypothetical protein